MTKKYFVALARELAARRPCEPRTSRLDVDQWTIDVLAVSDVCERFNQKFDREKFLTACGVSGVRGA